MADEPSRFAAHRARLSAAALALASILLLTACEPPPISDSGDETPAEQFEAPCERFCDRALECSIEVASQWGYADHDGCVDYCVQLSEAESSADGKQHCVQANIDLWECAASIELCSEFQAWEQMAFAGEGFSPHCQAELEALVEGDCFL